MLGRTPAGVDASWPLEDGVIADIEGAEELLRQLLRRVLRGWLRPRVAICVPADATEVETRAFEQAVRHAGARDVHVIEAPLAAAIGLELPVESERATMIVDVGGGVTEAAVICLGGLAAAKSRRVGGTAIDAAIISYLKRERSLVVGEMTAEAVKIGIGSASPAADGPPALVAGRHLHTGLPNTVTVEAAEIRAAIDEPVSCIVDTVKGALDMTPPELSADVSRRGIMLSGGTSLLRGLANRLREEVGVPVFVADDPLNAVAVGAGRCLLELGALANATRRSA